jgi:hypothetical protein
VLPFEDAIDHEPALVESALSRLLDNPLDPARDFYHRSYLTRGHYAEQLERWFSVFSREQFLVLSSDDLRRDPAAAVAACCSFLSVPVRPARSYPLRLKRDYEPMKQDTREQLAAYFEPHNRRLYELLGRDFGWTRPG